MSYQATVLADSPVGYWPLTEGTGTAADVSGGANPGTYVGGTSQVSGPLGGDTATLFNGTTGRVSAPWKAAYLDNDVLTMTAFIRRTATTTGTQGIVSKGKNDAYLRLNGTSLDFLKSNSADLGSSSGVTLGNDSLWHHVAIVKNGATTHMYLDGVDVTGPITNATMAAGEAISIGSDIANSVAADFFNGRIAHAAYFNTALSPARIQAHIAAAWGVNGPRWFSSSSPYNFPGTGVVDPNSAAWMSAIQAFPVSNLFINQNGFTNALYSIDPRRDTGWTRRSIYTATRSVRCQGVPLNSSMFIPTDSDHGVAIYDEQYGVWYNPYAASALDGNGDWDAGGIGGAVGTFKASRSGWWKDPTSILAQNAAGSLYVGGMVFPEELYYGQINHALVCSMPSGAHSTAFRSPASRSDGTGSTSTYPPMGCRYTLDPAVDVTTLTTNPYLQVLYKALQNYGMIDIDSNVGNTFTLYAPHSGGYGYPYQPGSDPPRMPPGVTQVNLASIVPHLRVMTAEPSPTYENKSTMAAITGGPVYTPAGPVLATGPHGGRMKVGMPTPNLR